MCRKVTCKECGRPSWAGCGSHVEQVLGDVPAGERCPGHTSEGRASSADGRLARLFGRA